MKYFENLPKNPPSNTDMKKENANIPKVRYLTTMPFFTGTGTCLFYFQQTYSIVELAKRVTRRQNLLDCISA